MLTLSTLVPRALHRRHRRGRKTSTGVGEAVARWRVTKGAMMHAVTWRLDHDGMLGPQVVTRAGQTI
jgi:hypothetical protein